MSDLAITLVQCPLTWEDTERNVAHFDAEIDRLEDATDLIILPEMFSTGFSMNAETVAETMDGKAATWLRNKAVETNTVITGSAMIRDDGKFYNRLLWASPDGSLATYNKKHLFRYAGEEKVYTPGQQQTTLELNGWKIRPFICYDLRFPIWTRNLDHAYDLAIFVANWPTRRAPHWRALLKARAIENQAYIAAVNRVGQDGNGIEYSGHSAVITPTGDLLFEKAQDPCTVTITLSRQALTDYRRSFPAWMDADADMITSTID